MDNLCLIGLGLFWIIIFNFQKNKKRIEIKK